MSHIRLKSDKKKTRYSVKDDQCIGKDCLTLGLYQVRGASGSGSRNTGEMSPCCMTRAYHGCPDGHEYSLELAAKRKAEGHANC